MMDKKIKAKWVKALESGKYKQGQSCLRSQKEQFCCLGVLCDVLGTKWEKNTTVAPGTIARYLSTGPSGQATPNSATLPDWACRKAKIYPKPSELDEIDSLISMNDTGKSFKQIAKWIKENL